MSEQTRREEARARLASLLARHGDALPLGEAAACFAAEEDPGVTVEEVLARLDALARGLRLVPGEPVETSVARLTVHLVRHHGLLGDLESYDHPDNSLLHRVIDRRLGLPILLAVVWMEVGRRVGLTLHGVGFPGHFLLSTDGPDRFFVDPFHEGTVRTEASLRGRLSGMGLPPDAHAELLAPVPARAIVMRMCRNLRGSWERRDRPDDAARSASRLALLEGRG